MPSDGRSSEQSQSTNIRQVLKEELYIPRRLLFEDQVGYGRGVKPVDKFTHPASNLITVEKEVKTLLDWNVSSFAQLKTGENLSKLVHILNLK